MACFRKKTSSLVFLEIDPEFFPNMGIYSKRSLYILFICCFVKFFLRFSATKDRISLE